MRAGLGVDVPEGAREISPEAGVCMSGNGTVSVELGVSRPSSASRTAMVFFDFGFLLTKRETT